MIALLQSSWFVVLVGGLLYLGTTASLLRPAQFAGWVSAQAAATLSPDDAPSWRFKNPEFDQLVQELRRERETLALREQELRELQARLDAERLELQSVTQMVARLQGEFDRNVIRFQQQEAENLKRQLRVMAGLTPEAAARMVAELPEPEVVKLLSLMKPDEAAGLLDAIIQSGNDGAKRAAALTEKMRRVLPAAADRPRG